MKFAVINGSPKGQISVTLQSVEYLKLKFPWIDFEVIHAGQKIKALERHIPLPYVGDVYQ